MEERGLMIRYSDANPPECEYLNERAGEFYAVTYASNAARYRTCWQLEDAKDRACNQGWPMRFCDVPALLLQFTHEPRTNKNLGENR